MVLKTTKIKMQNSPAKFFMLKEFKRNVVKIQAECFPCLLSQVLKTTHLLRPNMSNEEIVLMQRKIMEKMLKEQHQNLPYYGKIVYETIAEEFKDPDPYRKIKRRDNLKVQSWVPKLKTMVSESDDPLLTVVKLMLIGNTIDFGAPHNSNFEEDFAQINNFEISVQTLEKFRTNLENSRNIMIIGDNCGEAVFDKIFIEYIRDNYPDKHFVYGVRGGAAINDITLVEAQEIELPSVCEVVEGSPCPGVIWELVSDDFSKAFHSADLIISKGQGNFESLEDVKYDPNHKPKGLLYFFLKAKCEVVAGYFNVPVGSLIFQAF